MRCSVGHSTLDSSHEAGCETAKKAKDNLKNIKLGMLYTSVDYDQKEVMNGISSELGDVPVIGCTSSGGIIVPDGVITSEKGFAGMLTIEDENLIVGVSGSPKKGSARETGQKVAMEALERAGLDYAPSYYYMVASPGEEEYYAKGIQDIIGDVPLFGGSAADNTIEGKWKIFCNGEEFSDGVAVAFFYTDKPMETVYTGAYKETKNVGIITKVHEDRKLMEIDGTPAVEKYAEWTGTETDKLMGNDLLVASITKPLGVKDPLGNLVAIRHPMGGNDDMSMNIGNNLAENTAIIQMEASVDELISSTGKVLKEVNKKINKPAGYLLVHCGGRKVGIGDRINEVHKEIEKEAKGKPYIVPFTFGEYGYNDHSANTCGGLMLSFTGFEE